MQIACALVHDGGRECVLGDDGRERMLSARERVQTDDDGRLASVPRDAGRERMLAGGDDRRKRVLAGDDRRERLRRKGVCEAFGLEKPVVWRTSA